MYDMTTIIFAAKGKGADFVVVVSLTKHQRLMVLEDDRTDKLFTLN